MTEWLQNYIKYIFWTWKDLKPERRLISRSFPQSHHENTGDESFNT
jgi:hypothetical protein